MEKREEAVSVGLEELKLLPRFDKQAGMVVEIQLVKWEFECLAAT